MTYLPWDKYDNAKQGSNEKGEMKASQDLLYLNLQGDKQVHPDTGISRCEALYKCLSQRHHWTYLNTSHESSCEVGKFSKYAVRKETKALRPINML